jgi:hypothetical protein
VPHDPPKKPTISDIARALANPSPTKQTLGDLARVLSKAPESPPRRLGELAGTLPHSTAAKMLSALVRARGSSTTPQRLPSPAAYMVSYDLKSEASQYAPLFDELKRSHAWWHYLESTWIVVRYDPMVDFANKIVPLIYQPDRLVIMPAKGPALGWLPTEAWNWIAANVPREW